MSSPPRKQAKSTMMGSPIGSYSQLWERKALTTIYLNTFKEKFDTYHKQNRNLDCDTKLSAIKVSATVVGIGCISLDPPFHHFSCSGTIVKSTLDDHTTSTYVTTVMTTASLFGSSSDKKKFKLEVYTCNGSIFKVKDFEYDHHYNIAILKFASDSLFSTATLRCVDDSYTKSLRSLPHSQSFHLAPGDKVIAIGRYFKQPFDLMAAPGVFSAERCNLDCQQLLRATSKISKCGTGGPLINMNGQVIGVNFYDEDYTPFLPVNIALKCVENLEKFGNCIRPCFGIKATNVCVETSLAKLEKIMQKFPDHSRGVLVQQVAIESCAHRSGIRKGDLIVQCEGKVIKSLLEFDTILLDKVGKSVELYVARKAEGSLLKITAAIEETSPDKFYRWPIPKERCVRVN
ncbi:hypothetical protein ACHQM5_028135 [Ranunculus cassubicifolius]